MFKSLSEIESLVSIDTSFDDHILIETNKHVFVFKFYDCPIIGSRVYCINDFDDVGIESTEMNDIIEYVNNY